MSLANTVPGMGDDLYDSENPPYISDGNGRAFSRGRTANGTSFSRSDWYEGDYPAGSVVPETSLKNSPSYAPSVFASTLSSFSSSVPSFSTTTQAAPERLKVVGCVIGQGRENPESLLPLVLVLAVLFLIRRRVSS